MNTEQYTDDDADDYAPNPKASQEAARRSRRARGDAPDAPITTIPLSQRAVLLIAVSAGLIILVLALILSRPSGALVIPAATVSAQSFDHAQEGQREPISATPSPTAAVIPVIPAYAAPDGLVLGSIESTRRIVPVAHFGTGWIQADVEGSGRIWLRASDLPGVALVGPDLAPAPQTGRGMPQEPQVVEAAPAPVPTADFYTTPPQIDPAFQQSLIGSDPNALACNGSVWCGGLTNAEAQAALDAQRATAAAR